MTATTSTTFLCHHNTQESGTNPDRAVIDIGKVELAAGCTFVAMSRLKNLNHAFVQPMSLQRLQGISTGKRFAERLQVETRSHHLASVTS